MLLQLVSAQVVFAVQEDADAQPVISEFETLVEARYDQDEDEGNEGGRNA